MLVTTIFQIVFLSFVKQFAIFKCFQFEPANIFFVCGTVKLLTTNKFLDWSKFKTFADDKINVNDKLKFGLRREENMVRIGENAGNHNFLLFPPCILKPSISWSLKVKTL